MVGGMGGGSAQVLELLTLDLSLTILFLETRSTSEGAAVWVAIVVPLHIRLLLFLLRRLYE